jgi:hypothetical protein
VPHLTQPPSQFGISLGSRVKWFCSVLSREMICAQPNTFGLLMCLCCHLVCVRTPYVLIVSCGQTVHRWSPSFCILVYLYSWHKVVQSEFRQRPLNCQFTDEVGLRKNGKSKNGMLDYGVWKFIYRVNMSASWIIARKNLCLDKGISPFLCLLTLENIQPQEIHVRMGNVYGKMPLHMPQSSGWLQSFTLC